MQNNKNKRRKRNRGDKKNKPMEMQEGENGRYRIAKKKVVKENEIRSN